MIWQIKSDSNCLVGMQSSHSTNLNQLISHYTKLLVFHFDFNARTWHMGGVNQTDRPRHAVTMNVCRSYMRQRFDYPRLVSPEIANQLGEVSRRFLGFNVRMPTSLEEYYLPEESRLYKANQG